MPVFLAAGLRYPQGRSVKDRPCFFCLVLKKFTDICRLRYKSSSDDRPGPGICGSKYVEDEKAARSVKVWDRVPIKNKAEGLVLAGASCCRTCHLCVAFHRRSGFPCPPTPARHLMTCLNPPNPLFKGGTSGPTGFPSPQRPPCPPTPARHLMMPW